MSRGDHVPDGFPPIGEWTLPPAVLGARRCADCYRDPIMQPLCTANADQRHPAPAPGLSPACRICGRWECPGHNLMGPLDGWKLAPGAPVDFGDQTCADADGSPEAAGAFAAGALETVLREHARLIRDRLAAAVWDYLRRSETDWERFALDAETCSAGDVVVDAKALHDAQLVELFHEIGLALPSVVERGPRNG